MKRCVVIGDRVVLGDQNDYRQHARHQPHLRVISLRLVFFGEVVAGRQYVAIPSGLGFWAFALPE